MTGLKMDFNKHCRIAFDEYAKVYDETRNDMTERTVGGICLGPTNNIQGGYQFTKLSTGKVITKYKFYKVPMTQEVIERVIETGRQQKAIEGLHFNNENLNEDEITGVDENEDEYETVEYTEEFDNENIDMRHSNEDDVILDYEEREDDQDEEEEEEEDVYNMIEEIEEDLDDDLDELETLLEEDQEENENYVTRYGRESKPPTNYEPSFIGQRYEQAHITMGVEYALQQYSLMKGLKKFGKRGEDAAMDELRQQHMRESFKPMVPSNIPPEKREKF